MLPHYKSRLKLNYMNVYHHYFPSYSYTKFCAYFEKLKLNKILFNNYQQHEKSPKINIK